ncbi:hypothetical protein CBM2634_P190005 [Cupriavidus taiwanensis]|uniref:Uncharacterized protein n=1 Tax=Cupriavidus taiwanensis TaxID=164546 RepID=A0A375JDN4_9BURK|nr:hypothetical protein CBM2634_P190005 [Cupriavidus taiwanensis]
MSGDLRAEHVFLCRLCGGGECFGLVEQPELARITCFALGAEQFAPIGTQSFFCQIAFSLYQAQLTVKYITFEAKLARCVAFCEQFLKFFSSDRDVDGHGRLARHAHPRVQLVRT